MAVLTLRPFPLESSGGPLPEAHPECPFPERPPGKFQRLEVSERRGRRYRRLSGSPQRLLHARRLV